MTAPTHITGGRTVSRALPVAVVVTAVVVGSGGTAAAPIDGNGDDPSLDGLSPSLDGPGDALTLSASLDGKGNDVYPHRVSPPPSTGRATTR
ncbi:hypothetical protein [Salinigranum sp.]|uniref:hypothetical protein n=1 Tax=Salinigranum sp. TaxID=1966351 RepID=UPI0035630938